MLPIFGRKSSTDVIVEVESTLATETPPTSASLQVAGIRIGDTDLTFTKSGATATLVSAADVADWTVLGLLPGLGASISSFLSYTVARKRSKHPELFGKGALEGVATAEAADNATVPASLIPVFAIGVPGSLSTALLMGAFMLHGLTPGPLIFKDDAALVFGIYNGMILAALLLFLIGYVGQKFFAKVIQLPATIISPIVVLLCVIGAYVEGGGMFNVYLMLAFAFVGYFMKKFDLCYCIYRLIMCLLNSFNNNFHLFIHTSHDKRKCDI